MNKSLLSTCLSGLKEAVNFLFPPPDEDVVLFNIAMDEFMVAHVTYAVMSKDANAALEDLSRAVLERMSTKGFIWPKQQLGPFPIPLTIDDAVAAIVMTSGDQKISDLALMKITKRIAAQFARKEADAALDRLCTLGGRLSSRYPWTAPKVNGAVSLQASWKKAFDQAELHFPDVRVHMVSPASTPHDLKEDIDRAERKLGAAVDALITKCAEQAVESISTTTNRNADLAS